MPALAALIVAGCDDPCENVIVQRARAEYGNADAVVFERSCGATTGYSTHVSIVDRGAAVGDGGNIFVAEGSAFEDGSNTPSVAVEWAAPDQLTVHASPSLRVVRSSDRYGNIAIVH